MADLKKNPLIGAFQTPVPGETPSSTTEEKKPPESPKVDSKAAGAATLGKTDKKKPLEPPKGETKGTGAAVPGKPGEKKPPEPPKGETKGTGAAAPGKPDEKKPPEPPKGETKGTGAAAPGKPGEKKPPEPPKDETKGTGAAAPGKPDEKKLPEPPKGETKGTGAAAPGKPGEKKPPEPPKGETKGTGVAAPDQADVKKAPEQSKDQNLRYVKLSDIQPLPGTYVKDAPREDYSDLIASIKKSGLEKPVILLQGEKGGYQLVDGFHRCEALKRAGILEVRADVYDMTIFDASRYRKEHRANPDLPIPGKLVPLHPDTTGVSERDGEAPEAEAPLPEDLKIPLAPAGQPETVTSLFECPPSECGSQFLKLRRRAAQCTERIDRHCQYQRLREKIRRAWVRYSCQYSPGNCRIADQPGQLYRSQHYQ